MIIITKFKKTLVLSSVSQPLSEPAEVDLAFILTSFFSYRNIPEKNTILHKKNMIFIMNSERMNQNKVNSSKVNSATLMAFCLMENT